MRLYHNIAWVLTLLVAICAIVVGNTDLPGWTVAVVAVVAGFWWAFGKGFVGAEDAGRQPDRNHGEG